ncbi:GDP-fucose protein O-fucosyltransferase protein [Actinidia chinensis var. chinensis]|uniref:O-fucosyltransferase family protein n=1 Tax=Actinidia chinensis var. chinensis TaxID=1590841 RepID=A0A2R6PW34_ACTCC|nr:GDP-fucose protein O-fucosyltransferase protein [Actinidia chinensis var. chinensis]
MLFKSKIKWAALGGLVLSFLSLLVHLLLAKYSSADLVQYSAFKGFIEDLNINVGGRQGTGYRKVWRNVKSLESLQPYANARSRYPVPTVENNGFIYAKIFGGFEKIRSSICDLVTISRLLNATLVIPEIQESTNSKGISSKFKSFSYIYNEEQFIAGLKNDVTIVKSLPPNLKELRKKKHFPTFKPKSSASPTFYIKEVLPKLKEAKVVGLVLYDGGCLQPILPSSLAEYQRLRCRVAFHALHFRPEILALGHLMVERLRALGQPYLAFHPGLVRDMLAYHGCAELFQDVHTELIQYRRAQMIKQGIVNEELRVDSHVRKGNGSCPLMPEEVGLLLRAMGYPPKTRIYLAGSEIFGGQRVLIPLRAMYTNLVDRTSLCTEKELANLIGQETLLPEDTFLVPPSKSADKLKKEWDKAGPRPRPLPPPPDRPIYRHEKEGWYGWVAEKDLEPDPSPIELRRQAHRLLWSALDYIVSVEADAFFPGFNDGGSGWPDFSSLVMGHRLYEMASARTYRPDRKYLDELFNGTRDNFYHPKRNWTLSVREHLNKSLGEEGLERDFRLSKSKSFLSHPIPECSCRILETTKIHRLSYEGDVECPKWMEEGFKTVGFQKIRANESESEDEEDLEEQLQSDDEGNTSSTTPLSEQDEEMDPDD